MTDGIVFNIQRFCVNDGEGIRTTVFLKGCPLRCKWCHNPDGLTREPTLAFYERLCVKCGACSDVCKAYAHGETGEPDRDKCIACGACAEVCPTGALKIIGKRYTARQVVDECEKDVEYYSQSRGGITLSGGEPLYQAEFCLEIMRIAKSDGLSVALETCGAVPRSVMERAAEHVDVFLFDYKVTGREKRIAYTGSDGEAALSNLRYLNGIGKKIILRCPLVRGVNDDAEHFATIAKLANEYKHIARIEVLPYHRLGEGKNKSIGRINDFTAEEFTSVEVRNMISAIAQNYSGEVICA